MNANIQSLLIAERQNLKAATGWGGHLAQCGSQVALPTDLQRLAANFV